MDGSCDPESAELIWKLHRELNGLTRSSRRPNAEFMALENPPPRRENRPAASRGKTKAPSTSQQQQPEAKRKKVSQQEETTDANTASKPAKTTVTDEPSCKAPPPPTSLAPLAGQKSRFHPNASLQHGASLQNQQQDSLNRDCPTSAKPAVPVALATETSPLVAAALAAGQLVRERAQRTGGNGTGHHHIKCFYAGVRWGLALKPSDIQSRAELATALNDALAGEILSCGKGDNLHIVFLDNAGSICEFPSLRSSGSSAKESLQKWQAAVMNAVKVYVRRV